MTLSLRKGGVLNAKRIASVREKHGVDYVSQIESVKEHKKQTSLWHYGVDHPWQADVEYPMQNDDIMEKRKETSRNLYGTAFPFERLEIREKAIATNIAKFGVAVPIHSLDVRVLADFSQAAQKCHQTMKRNGSYHKSKPEDRLYEVLCEIFGVDDVERQAIVNDHWAIDFHVKSIDTYVQYDSYWHGVGRALDEVAQFKTKRDVVIHKKMLTDIAQEKYFEEHSMKLVRVKNMLPCRITSETINPMLRTNA